MDFVVLMLMVWMKLKVEVLVVRVMIVRSYDGHVCLVRDASRVMYVFGIVPCMMSPCIAKCFSV